MVHHISLLETKPTVTLEQVESLMVEARIRLLKIPEVNNLRVGKRIDVKENPYTLFYSFDCETMDKLRIINDSAIFAQFQKQILTPNIAHTKSFDYEMDPGKDVRYS